MDANDQISSRTSTYLIEDASYFRLKNIQLTYTFDDAINNALGISGGQIYLQGQNLATFTKYSGLNPEIQTGNDIQLGYDGGYMPVSKTFYGWIESQLILIRQTLKLLNNEKSIIHNNIITNSDFNIL